MPYFADFENAKCLILHVFGMAQCLILHR